MSRAKRPSDIAQTGVKRKKGEREDPVVVPKEEVLDVQVQEESLSQEESSGASPSQSISIKQASSPRQAQTEDELSPASESSSSSTRSALDEDLERKRQEKIRANRKKVQNEARNAKAMAQLAQKKVAKRSKPKKARSSSSSSSSSSSDSSTSTSSDSSDSTDSSSTSDSSDTSSDSDSDSENSDDSDSPSDSSTKRINQGENHSNHSLHEEPESSHSDDESTQFSSDSDSDEMDTAIDNVAFLKTLSRIQNKDQSLYAGDAIYEQERNRLAAYKPDQPKQTREKKVTMKDLQRQAILNREWEQKDPEAPLTHVQEQSKLKEDLMNAIGDDSEDELLTSKEPKHDHLKDFILEQVGQEELEKVIKITTETAQSLKPSENPQSDQKFLMDYILNRGWIEREDENPEILEDSDGEISQAEAYEEAYNMHDMPGGPPTTSQQLHIISHPRQALASVRRKDDRRSTQRKDKKERKAREREAKVEEIKHEKNKLKRRMEDDLAEVSKKKKDFDWEDEPETEAEKQRLKKAWLQQIDALDFEDIIEDMTTRFKYVPVNGESFGLRDEEILMADDDALNELVPLKKLAAYRNDLNKTKYHPSMAQKLTDFRKTIKGKRFIDPAREPKERMGKKERQRIKNAATPVI